MPELKRGVKTSSFGNRRYSKAREKAKVDYVRRTSERARCVRARSASCPTESKTCILPQYQSYYVTLGVPEDASQRLIKNTFMKLARTHHPDRNKGRVSQKKQREWAEYCLAYQALSDAQERKAYDENSAMRAAVTAFYAKHNPLNLRPEVIEPVLEKYRGHELELLNDLHAKYGATSYHKPHTTPPSSPPPDEAEQAAVNSNNNNGTAAGKREQVGPTSTTARSRSESYPSAREWRSMPENSPARVDIRKKIASQAGIGAAVVKAVGAAGSAGDRSGSGRKRASNGLLDKMSTVMDNFTEKILGETDGLLNGDALFGLSPQKSKLGQALVVAAAQAQAAAVHGGRCQGHAAVMVALWCQHGREAGAGAMAMSATAAACAEYAAAAATATVAACVATLAANGAVIAYRRAQAGVNRLATESLTQRLRRKSTLFRRLSSSSSEKSDGGSHGKRSLDDSGIDAYADVNGAGAGSGGAPRGGRAGNGSGGGGGGGGDGEFDPHGCAPPGFMFGWARLAFGEDCAPGLHSSFGGGGLDRDQDKVTTRDLAIPPVTLGLPRDIVPPIIPPLPKKRFAAIKLNQLSHEEIEESKREKERAAAGTGLVPIDRELTEEREKRERLWELKRQKEAMLRAQEQAEPGAQGAGEADMKLEEAVVVGTDSGVAFADAVEMWMSKTSAGRAVALASAIAATAASSARLAVITSSVFAMRWQIRQRLKQQVQQLQSMASNSSPHPQQKGVGITSVSMSPSDDPYAAMNSVHHISSPSTGKGGNSRHGSSNTPSSSSSAAAVTKAVPSPPSMVGYGSSVSVSVGHGGVIGGGTMAGGAGMRTPYSGMGTGPHGDMGMHNGIGGSSLGLGADGSRERTLSEEEEYSNLRQMREHARGYSM